MKRQIRRSVFESNSSSVHALSISTRDEYAKWERGELYRRKWEESFFTREEIIEQLKVKKYWKTEELLYSDIDWENKEVVDELIRKNGYLTEKEFWDDIEYDYETFSESYTTPKGDIIKVFGYFGYDG